MKTVPIKRFWEKIVGLPNGCWEWRASCSSDGYGSFWNGYRHTRAPRYAYEHFIGGIPRGLQLDHLCRNILCVNPAHLEAVTCRENLMRGETYAAQNFNKTHCMRGHPFDEENTYICPKGTRKCLTCKRASWQKFYLKRRKYAKVHSEANA